MVFLLCGLACVSQPVSSADRVPDVRCGSHALYIALRASGLDGNLSSFEDLERTLGPPGPSGYSLGALAAEAASRGAHTAPVVTSVEKLRLRRQAEKFACIALLKSKHFVLLYDLDDKYAYIIDFPKEVRVPIDTLNSIWSANCLLLSKNPLRSEAQIVSPWYSRSSVRYTFLTLLIVILATGTLYYFRRFLLARRVMRTRTSLWLVGACLASSCLTWGCRPHERGHLVEAVTNSERGPTKVLARGLRISPILHELGIINLTRQTSPISVKSTLHNMGKIRVGVVGIKTSCSCTSVALDQYAISPDGESTLQVTINPGTSSGTRETALQIVTDEPSQPEYVVAFRWTTVSTLRADPEQVRWAGLRPEEPAQSDVSLMLADCSLCNRCRVVVSSAAERASCSFEWSAGMPKVSHDDATGRLGTWKAGTIHIRPSTGLSVGEQADTVIARLVCGSEERAHVKIPVYWAISPTIQVSPGSISLGVCSPAESIGRSIMIRTRDGEPLSVDQVTCSEANVLVATRIRQVERSMAAASLTFRVPRAPGVWTGVLTVTTNHPDARILKIPFSALIKDD